MSDRTPTAPSMRAKFTIESIKRTEYGDTVSMRPVCAKQYPADGSDEDNTFAKFTPSGNLELNIQNPALIGQYNPGDTFYLDFTPVPKEAASA